MEFESSNQWNLNPPIEDQFYYRINLKTKPITHMGIHMIAETSSSRSHKEEISISVQREILIMTEAISPQTTSSYVEPKMENLDEVQTDPEFPDRVTFIRVHLTSPLCEEIISVLTEHRDCFTWSYGGMTGIDPSIIIHKLQVNPEFSPIKQKRQRFPLSSTKRYRSYLESVQSDKFTTLTGS